ncbi:MAG: hypothetical protein GY711_34365 [bacterium]|nr:hypothetical protein [bacterium]
MNATLLFLAALAASPQDAAAVQGQHLAVEVRGEPFTTIHLDDAQVPYLYPVLGPGGMPLTRGYPMDPRPGEASDHPHHRSMWFTHGAVNGWDFWHEGQRAGRIRSTGAVVIAHEADAVRVTLNLEWLAGPDRLLAEVRTYRFSVAENERRIDVRSELRAVADKVVFGDTKEGSFAIRVRPELRLKGDGERAAGTMINAEGVRGKKVWGKRSAWVSYAGTCAGKTYGITVFDHPENPRHPTWWHARSYGLFAANPFGVHDFEKKPAGSGDLSLARDEKLVLRYRVLLHAGKRTGDEIGAAAFSE